MKRTRKEKGITLVALIITIIVLLILAVVSIRAVTGDGIIEYAKNARTDYTEAQTNEKYTLSQLEEYLMEEQTGVKVKQVTDTAPGVLEGIGIENDPYIINSIEDLVFFSYDVKQGNTYEGKYVNLGLNLDFNSTKSYVEAFRTDYDKYGYEGELKTALTNGEGFIPIGTTYNNGVQSNTFCFAGTFDGNGKIISNLRINKPNKLETDIAIFSANLGEIKNLGVKNCDINIKCSETPNGWGSISAICGMNYGKINNCWTTGDIEVTLNAPISMYVGAIVGCGNTLGTESSISNCYNKANINVIQNNTTVSLYVGGIHGGSANMSINNCYNTGNITGEYGGTADFRVGGIAGTVTTLNRCYNLGKIEGKKPTGPVVGGIAGGVGNGGAEHCCNIGETTYQGSSADCVGTLIGLITGTLSNSYSITNAELNGIGLNYGGVALEPTKVDTIAEMPTVLEIVGDGFKEDTNNINNGYPILSWQ